MGVCAINVIKKLIGCVGVFSFIWIMGLVFGSSYIENLLFSLSCMLGYVIWSGVHVDVYRIFKCLLKK